MKAFVRIESKEQVSINGYKGEVDWARDAVSQAFIVTAIKDREIRKNKLTNLQEVELMIADLKHLYRGAINEILGGNDASTIIFAEDGSMDAIEDVYAYLSAGYTAYRKRRELKYSPERLPDESVN